ncbi:MAG: hypothetical protein QM610_07860 [Chitinophagaceae bacterium]
MVPEKIQLRRVRTFGDTLNDVLQFLKQEFKPLMKGFFLICGIFLLAAGTLAGLYYGGAAGIWSTILTGRNATYYSDTYDSLGIFGVKYFMTLISILLVQLLVYTYVASYLKVYENNNELTSPTIEETWKIFRRNILPIVFYGIFLSILVGLGCLFCLAPGVYLGTVFSPFACIVVMEDDKSLGNVFNRCFSLIKDNFWPCLGLYIVSWLLSSICAGIVSLVVGGVGGVASYFTTKDIGSSLGIYTGVSQIFSAAFSIILYLAIGMQYFNMDEKRNGTGLMARIQNMNNDADD